MAIETSVILRSIMLLILKSEDLEEAYEAVKAMSTKDDETAVLEAFHNWQKRKEAKNPVK